jgi:hypothetical protein
MGEKDFRLVEVDGQVAVHALTETGRDWLLGNALPGVCLRAAGYVATAEDRRCLEVLRARIENAGMRMAPPIEHVPQRPGPCAPA